MTPHNFLLQHTPVSNCGECGYPTCLAFAVAVTRGGVSPDLCPYLNRKGLPVEFAVATGKRGDSDAVDGGQEQRDMALAAHLNAKMQGLDFRSLSIRLGAYCSTDHPEMLKFSFLGQAVELEAERIVLDGEQPADPRDQILLYNYVSFGGGRIPDGTWVGMESLPNSISKIRTLSTYCEQRLAERFSSRGSQLAVLCDKIGGQEGSVGKSADVGVIIPALPYVPLCLLFWDEEPEDGFSARVKILFDHHVMDFLDLESLVFTAERTADRLLELDC